MAFKRRSEGLAKTKKKSEEIAVDQTRSPLPADFLFWQMFKPQDDDPTAAGRPNTPTRFVNGCRGPVLCEMVDVVAHSIKQRLARGDLSAR
jgi:hypothetical protein